ncbi:MAG: ABC transporter ATP-binding protein [Actinobacteria bacterium RBG_16_64_13]|nr:MAG: ABC transporter ATP-binding protein [Actinobacteria bacterium RBG_16_64_13]
MTVILSAEHLTKSYGGVRVVDDLSVSLLEGEALGVVGPNGAGKTTLINLFTGIVHTDEGKVVFAGQDVSRRTPDQRCHAGMARTYQIPKPFEGMTVFENVLVGGTYGRGQSEKASHEICVRALHRASLLPQANVLAESLSLLERKRLELARALATEPKVLLLDEIAGGLTEQEVLSLVETIKQLRTEGISIIWIEHIVHALLAVVDRLMAIDFGRLIAEGDPKTVINSPQVRDVYMGSLMV